MNLTDKISKWFTYGEATFYETAKRLGIPNVPSESDLENLVYTATHIADPCREFVGGPLEGKFYRSAELNSKIPGADPTSLHLTGQAVDLDCDKYGHGNNKDLFDFVRTKLDYDKVIWEHGTNDKPDWVHVQTRKSGNRKLVVRRFQVFQNGQYVRDKSILFDLY